MKDAPTATITQDNRGRIEITFSDLSGLDEEHRAQLLDQAKSIAHALEELLCVKNL